MVMFAIALAALASCSLTSRQAPPPIETAKDVTAPLKLCQTPDAPPQSIAEKPGYAEYLVNVTDSAGNPLKGLTQKDFTVSRSNAAVPIQFFRGDTPPSPVSIAVVLDSSGSMVKKLGTSDSSKLQMVRGSISTVVSKLDACDEVSLITFGPGSDHIRLAQPLTTDHALVLRRLYDIQPFGLTPLYDSIHDASDALARADYPRRVMIVVTDALDNTSVTSLNDLLSQVRQRGVPIYVIGMGDPSPDKRRLSLVVGPFMPASGDADYLDLSVLKQISDATAGETFVVSPVDEDTGAALSAALEKINGNLSSGYTIGVVVNTTAAPEVAVNAHPDATVRLHPVFLKQPAQSAPASPPPP